MCLMTAVIILEQLSAIQNCHFMVLCRNSPAEDRMAIIVGAASQQLRGVPPAEENHFNSPQDR